MKPEKILYRRRRDRRYPEWRMSAREFDALQFLTRGMSEDIDRGIRPAVNRWRAVMYGNTCLAWDGYMWRRPVIVVRADMR